MFKAILIPHAEGSPRARLSDLHDEELPEGDVMVRVAYSTINYKDALAITGKGPVVRRYPMIPGIDLAGTVEKSDTEEFQPGDAVLLNGWGVGENHWGGLAGKARVSGKWLQPLPAGLTARDAMSIGTAGYTAMLCVLALERNGVTPEQGEVVVTGANGGVGSFAVHLLARRGYKVVASTGRMSEAEHLMAIGASQVVDRITLSSPGKPLAKERWAAGIDCVGSHTLANVCASTRYGGVVAACGLAQGLDFVATVAPFILRGVTLTGIDSVQAPMALREKAWQQLAKEITPDVLGMIVREVSLGDAIGVAEDLLQGRVKGRIVVDVDA